jgi:hypothetical protein
LISSAAKARWTLRRDMPMPTAASSIFKSAGKRCATRSPTEQAKGDYTLGEACAQEMAWSSEPTVRVGLRHENAHWPAAFERLITI